MKNITSKFHVHPSRSRNHSLYLFPEFSLFFLAFPRVERRDISFNNWNFFRGSKMDRFLFLESMGSNGNGEIRSRTAARFNWISNVARLELDLYFAFRAREWSRGSQSVADFTLAPRRTAVDLVSRSGNREKGGFLLPLPRSKIKFPFPTFYLLEGASLSPTSTSKLHFPRVWSSRNASREIDSLNSIDEPSWRSGVRVLTSFIRLPSSLKACLRSREIKINELVEFNPNFSRNRRAECYLRSRKCLHSARKKKKREIISVSPYRWKISKEINERRCIIFVARVLSWFIGGNPFNPLRSRGDSQSPRRFDSLFTLDFSLRLIRARILTRFPYLFISLLGDNRELVL